MGWEFAALWLEDGEAPWKWVWRRVADDSGAVISESAPFTDLDRCLEDAKANGFEEADCGPLS